MENVTKRIMPTTAPIEESGASIVMHELCVLSSELTGVVNRCASRISPILRPDTPNEEKSAVHRGLESELFSSIYCHVTECHAMIAHLHSILDRVDL